VLALCRPRRSAGAGRCARASAKRHHTRPGGVAPAAFAPPAHRKKVLATGATGLCTPSQKKEKHRRSPCKAVALVAGCFDRSSVPSSVSWWPPTPRPGPPQVADLTTRRCPRQPKEGTTRHCLVPVLCRGAKTSFPEARTTPLRSVVLSRPKSKRTRLCRAALGPASPAHWRTGRLGWPFLAQPHPRPQAAPGNASVCLPLEAALDAVCPAWFRSDRLAGTVNWVLIEDTRPLS
jgi:hypothetical protein